MNIVDKFEKEQIQLQRSCELNSDLAAAMLNNLRKMKKIVQRQINCLACNGEIRDNLGREAANEKIALCKHQREQLKKQFDSLNRFFVASQWNSRRNVKRS